MKHATTSIAGPEAANGHQALSGYIKSRFDEFSRSQKDVAQYIVDHLDEAAFQTAEELARRANTSSSTVVRFSQAPVLVTRVTSTGAWSAGSVAPRSR
jgi:hypothetical protein